MAGSNPFSVFRQHQKQWLAWLGVLTILSFVVIPALMQWMSRGDRRIQTVTIARCRQFGDIDQMTLKNLQNERIALNRFFKALAGRIAPQVPLVERALLPIAHLELRVDNETIINDWLLAHYAQQKGLHISNQAVTDYIAAICGGFLDNTIYQEALIVSQLRESQLDHLIKQYLLSRQMLLVFYPSRLAVTPAKNWELFQRVNRRITLEVAAVPVERFIGEVASPGKAQLQKFFDDYRDVEENPMSPELGLTLPLRLAAEYVVVAPSQQMLDSVTKEEIEKYYEENKATKYRKKMEPILQRPDLPGLSPLGGGQGGFGGLGGLGGAMPFPTTRLTGNTEPGSHEEPKPEASTPEEPKSEEQPNVAEEPKNEMTYKNSSARWIPVLNQTEKPADEEMPATETKPAEESTPAVEPKPATEEAPAEETKPAEDAAAATDLSILYLPLSEVEGEIRRILAFAKAEAASVVVEEQMKAYFDLFYDAKDHGRPTPAPLDLKTIAEKQDLVFGSIPLGTFYNALKSDISKDIYARYNLYSLYDGSTVIFELKQFNGEGTKRYLLWFTDEQKRETPKDLASIKDRVETRWKELQARDLAVKHAEKLADVARQSEKSLAEAFANETPPILVAETTEFTWKRSVLSQRELFTSDIHEKGVLEGNADVDNKVIFTPGDEFMEKVYSLGVGEIGVALNLPKKTAYVVRVMASLPSEDSLLERFRNNPYSWSGYQYLLWETNDETYREWMKQIQEEVGFKWLKKPSADFYNE